MQKLNKPNLIKDRSFYFLMVSIALPIVLQNMITISVNIMDTVMLGKMGEIQLSASSLANNYVEIPHILNLGISAGGCILIAQYWGREDYESIKKVVSLMMRVSIFCSLIATILATLFPEWILHLYTSDEEVVEKGVVYLKWMLPAFILHGCSIAMTFSLRSMRKVSIPFIAAIVAFVVNIFFNWVFIFGKLGAPRMEIAGAALGTVLSRIAEFFVIGFCFFKENKKIGFKIADLFGNCSDQVGVFFKFGLPVIVSDLFLTLGSNTVSIIMGHVGTAFVAAFAIVAPSIRLVNVATIGLAQASATITGNTVGKGNMQESFDCGFSCFVLSIAAGIISGIIFYLIGPFVISFYDVSNETYSIALEIIRALAIVSVFQAIGTVLTKGILRGGGDSKFILILDTLFLWVISVPVGYMCGLVWHTSAFITFFALRLDNVFKAIVCSRRLLSGKWIKRVPEINAN